jgi:hypothetical protein
MPTSVVTAAPILATLAAAGWLVWSHINPTPVATLTKGKAIQIEAARLVPSLGNLPPRDPFRLQGTAPPITLRVAAPSEKAVPGKSPRTTAVASTLEQPKGRPSLSKRFASMREAMKLSLNKASRAVSRAKLLATQVQETLSGQVRLSATMIRGEQRMAVVNNRMVSEGQPILNLGTLEQPVLLAQVRASSVVLYHRGASAVVSFPALATSTNAPPAPRQASISARSVASKSKTRSAPRRSGARP